MLFRSRGTKLIFPPVLRLLSHYFPLEFPYHKNGKMTEGHMAYWQLFPTINHVQPVARGGVDNINNWVCCSMLTNSIKSNWTLDELEWDLLPSGSVDDWDGMVGWFIKQTAEDPEVLVNAYIRRWLSAIKSSDYFLLKSSLTEKI